MASTSKLYSASGTPWPIRPRFVRSIQWAARHANGRVVEPGPSDDDFAPEAQTDETMGPDAAEHMIETGSPS
jgi:carbon-monoxide dehydrogenase small subunit